MKAPKADDAAFWAAISDMVKTEDQECVIYAFEDLAAFAEGRLKRADQQALGAHLRYCRCCRHVVRELQHELAHAETNRVMEKTFGVFEAKLMSLLWQLGRSLSAEELRAALASDQPEVDYAQVLAGLTSLHRRGYVKRGEGRFSGQYAPAVSPQDLQPRPLLSKLAGQAATPALSYFIEENEAEELLESLSGADATPPDDEAQGQD